MKKSQYLNMSKKVEFNIKINRSPLPRREQLQIQLQALNQKNGHVIRHLTKVSESSCDSGNIPDYKAKDRRLNRNSRSVDSAQDGEETAAKHKINTPINRPTVAEASRSSEASVDDGHTDSCALHLIEEDQDTFDNK